MMASRARPEPVSTTVVTPLRLLRKKSSRVWDVDADEPSSASPAWSSYRRKFSEEDDTPTTASSSRRRSSILAPASDSKARRASIWDSILAPDGLSDDDEDFSSSSPLHAFQQAFDMSDDPVDEGFEVESSDSSLKIISKPDEELSSDSDDEIARLEHHLIAQKFDKNDELDCAEQHEDLFHSQEHHSLLSSAGQPEEVHHEANSKPTRRATLFGNVIGVYQTPVQEGSVKLTHCLGDEVSDISQALRVLKSNTRHRVKLTPQLHYDDLRPNEPRYLPDASGAVEEDGLLAAIQTARRNRVKERANKNLHGKLDPLTESSSHVPMSPPPILASPRSPLSPTSPSLLDGRRVSRRLSLVSIGKTGSRSSTGRHIRNGVEMTAHVAHLEALREEQRMNKLHERKDRIHETMEYFAFRPNDIFQVLRQNYDPDGFAHCTNAFYAPANLLKREALRFNREIQFLLRTIWRATDSDDSGAIDESEFKALHSCITCALLGRAALDETVRFYLFKQDWLQDSKGFTTLNRSRLEDSFFTLADRFCVGIEASEYIACLNRLLSRIVKFNSDTGEVGLRSEDEIWALNDIDPLIDDKVFQFKSKKERDRDEKVARAQIKEKDKTAASQKINRKETSPQPKRRLSSIPSFINRKETSNDFSEEHSSKFIVVFDWAPEDGEQGVLSLTRGEVVYSAKRNMNLSIGPPPDPEGWIFCRKFVNNENVFGWCPEGMILLVTREKKERLFSLGSIHEDFAENLDPSGIHESTSGFDSDDSSERVEVLKLSGFDADYGLVNKNLHNRSDETDDGMLRRSRTEAPTKAHSRQSDKMISNLSSVFGPAAPEDPTPRSIPDQKEILSGAMPEASTHTNLLSRTQPSSTLHGRHGRQRRIGGGNLQFPGYSFEPSQAMSELSSSQRLDGNHQTNFIRTQSASQKKRTMAGMALPQAQPAPHMVAAAARRYADSLKATSDVLHQRKQNSITARAASAPAWPLSTRRRRQDFSSGSVRTNATTSPYGTSQRKNSLGSVASNTLSSGFVSSVNTAPNKSFESINFGFTGVPQQVRPNPYAYSQSPLPAAHVTSSKRTIGAGRSYFNENPASNVLLSSMTFGDEPAKDVISRAQDYAQTRYLTVGSRSEAPHIKWPAKTKNRRHSRLSIYS